MKLHDIIFQLLLLTLYSGKWKGRCEVAQDNIALPQEESRQFVLPAPGIRHRPGLGGLSSEGGITEGGGGKGTGKQLQSFGVNPNFGVNLQPIQTPSAGIVGNLLPLQPAVAMAQVVSLDVACQREQMTVRIVFDGDFNGLMYAKGFYDLQQCHYVKYGTGGREFEFLVRAGSCGTQFVEVPGTPPYLENIVVIQNEPGIQEVWDTARGVRCVFDAAREGSSSQHVSAALNVAMLDQKVVTFAADTKGSASLDVQVGRGPFAPSASGMVKIGELMTMVVAVEGPANVDVFVRECIAHDGTKRDPYQLTDQNGCVLGNKKKVLGSWQKTRETGSTQIPVVAYAHFQAFKFPDKTDVYIECEVDLCSNACPVCPEDGGAGRKRRAVPVQKDSSEDKIGTLEEAADEAEALLYGRASPSSSSTSSSSSGTRRNSISDENDKNKSSAEAAVKLARRLRVISPEDYSIVKDSPITLVTKSGPRDADGMCMSVAEFVAGLVVMFVILVLSSVVTAILCIRIRTIPSTASTYPPDSSFHAFSTVSGKTL
ncbi:uncharacterized protein [Macrobrachium rosenbergii]|uniref:uncharacterized protein isoform X2 n=1 Tax=Macrobrachium rosenbergii TaxID=79674 RepID=UPI0034D431BA